MIKELTEKLALKNTKVVVARWLSTEQQAERASNNRQNRQRLAEQAVSDTPVASLEKLGL